MRGHLGLQNGTHARNATLALNAARIAALRAAVDESWEYTALFVMLASLCLWCCLQACSNDRFSVRFSDRRRAEHPLEKIPLIVLTG